MVINIVKQILKQNWVKIVILIIILGVGFYYLSVIRPAQNIEARIVNCRNLGREYKDKERRESPEKGSTFFVTWAYNKKLDTCSFKGGFDKEEWWNRYIVNLNTSEIVIHSNYKFPSMLDDSDYEYYSGLTTEEFNKQESELFDDSYIFHN